MDEDLSGPILHLPDPPTVASEHDAALTSSSRAAPWLWLVFPPAVPSESAGRSPSANARSSVGARQFFAHRVVRTDSCRKLYDTLFDPSVFHSALNVGSCFCTDALLPI